MFGFEGRDYRCHLRSVAQPYPATAQCNLAARFPGIAERYMRAPMVMLN